MGLDVVVESQLTTVRHAYTHFKIVMDVFECRYLGGAVTLDGPVDHRWLRVDELKTLPFPKANNKFIPMLLPKTSGSPTSG